MFGELTPPHIPINTSTMSRNGGGSTRKNVVENKKKNPCKK
jgi:hypothetical protein